MDLNKDVSLHGEAVDCIAVCNARLAEIDKSESEVIIDTQNKT